MSLSKALTAAAGNAGGDNLYVEDVFSTYLYTGNSSTQTITNDIDLAGEGGLVWIKGRSASYSHYLFDTERGFTAGDDGNFISSNNTNAESSTGNFGVSAFNSNGFSLHGSWNGANNSPQTFASWSFRKAEKFFDVVTYTGTGSARTVAHNLGSVPACIIIKKTSSGGDYWTVYHSSLGNTKAIFLNDGNEPVSTSSVWWNNTTPTDSVFTVGTAGGINASSSTMVAYLFASDAGGFGDDGSESIIKCGSVTTDGSGNASVDLGFEPQWCLWKCIDAAGGNEHGNWRVNDVMRGWPVPDASNTFGYPSSLYANTSGAETISGVDGFIKSATGFGFGQVQANKTYIYIAIRRPMKTPESGTEVFAVDGLANGTAPDPWFISNFVTDMTFVKQPSAATGWLLGSRLTGTGIMATNSTAAESAQSNQNWDYMNGVYDATANASYLSWMFKRATGFFDVVAYTGDSVAGRTVSHNLGVAPELMVVKARSDASASWSVYSEPLGNTKFLRLNSTNASSTSSSMWNNTSPTADVFTLGTDGDVNWSGSPNYIAYLFATLAGVSKVGSYTGTGADLNVDCGFSAGARFILIKRSDSTGDWYVWDSVRGIVAGNDPYLLLNSTAAEVTSTDYIDPLSSGFTVTSSAPAALNASGGSYIFLAIS
jgi:hypothetical protein